MSSQHQPALETFAAEASRGGALEQLFPRASAGGTLLQHWADGRFLVEHGAPKDLEERIAERLPTPEALADFAPDMPVSVYGFLDASKSKGTAGATDGVQPLYTFPACKIREAVPLYNAGHTVVCWQIRDHLPEALQRGTELGYPPSLPRVSTRENLVGEIEGVEMRRGSVLLIPRGVYHTTQVDDECSMSVGYHFTLPTWSHVVLAALERRLTRDPFMRTIPFGAFHLAGPTAQARERMAWVAKQAREALSAPGRLLEEELLGNLASHHQAAFRLTTDSTTRLLLDKLPVVVNYGGRGMDVELPAETGLLCRWMAGTIPNWFHFDDALAASGGRLSAPDLWNFLQEGVEAGFLERRWGRAGQHGAC